MVDDTMDTTKSKKFDPKEHLTKIKGKDYLEVKWRLVWFREDRPDWSIRTKIQERGDKWVIMKAFILNEKGRIISMAHKAETKMNFGDYLEKAETGAIGRALALCGYGTQFDNDLDEGECIVDAPVENKTTKQVEPPTEWEQ